MNSEEFYAATIAEAERVKREGPPYRKVLLMPVERHPRRIFSALQLFWMAAFFLVVFGVGVLVGVLGG